MGEASRRLTGGVATLALLLAAAAPARAQTMPAQTLADLQQGGHEKLAQRIAKKLELRSDPDAGDVHKLLERWTSEEGGPDTGYDWLTATRLWLRAGEPAEAEMALHEAESAGGVEPALLLLDQARVAFLARQIRVGGEAYWTGCGDAHEAAAKEYWLDIEILATPEEAEAWDRFRRLPATQTDLCGFLRRFWNERAAASATDVTTRLAQHYVRLRFALDHYRRRSGKKGATFSTRVGRPRDAVFDDRGLVYVRMGPPNRKTSFAGAPGPGQDLVSAECYQPNESWGYDFPGGTHVFHFTTRGGVDDWWLVENLGSVYRCGAPGASSSSFATGQLTPVNENRFVVPGAAAGLVLQDLYRSRQGLDPRYAQVANFMNTAPETQRTVGETGGLEGQRQLQRERVWTRQDAEYAITTVPERPSVDARSRLLFEELQFRGGRPGLTRVWLNGLIEADRLTADTLAAGHLRYRVQGRWALLDEAGRYRRLDRTFEVGSSRPLGKNESIPVRMAADLPPGTYEYTIVVRDAQAKETGGRIPGSWLRRPLTVRRHAMGAPVLSDIAVAPDSGGSWRPVPDVRLRPSPVHRTGPDGIAFIYYEAYNLTPGGEVRTTVRLQPDGGDEEPFTLTFPGEVPRDGTGTIRGFLRLDLRDTPRGAYRMLVTVEDGASGATTLPYATDLRVDRPGG